MRLFHHGLSLIEISIVLTLISVMMALSLPMLSTANARARSELCQQNLVEIGQAIVGYTQDTDHLPTLYNLVPTQTGLSLPEFVEPRLHFSKVVFCPSDETEASQALGTSYRWGMAFNDQPSSMIQHMLGQRMLADREPYHAHADRAINEMVVVEDEVGFRLSLVGEDPEHGPMNNRSEFYFKEKPRQSNKPTLPTHQSGDDD